MAHAMLAFTYKCGLPMWDTGLHFNLYGVFELAEAHLAVADRGQVEYYVGSFHDEAVDVSSGFVHAMLTGQIPDIPHGRLCDAMNGAIHQANASGAGLSLGNILSVLFCPVFQFVVASILS